MTTEDEDGERKVSYEKYSKDYSRAAASAITEFAPDNSFYAGGHTWDEAMAAMGADGRIKGTQFIVNGKTYIDKDGLLVCLEKDCPKEYPLIVDDGSKECLSKCPDNKYLDYPNKKCINNCEILPNKTASLSEGDNIAIKYSKNKCRCINIWYYDEVTGEEHCSDNNLDCQELTNNKFNYIIGSTTQCVSTCPNNSFTFGNKCFKSCYEASQITNKNLIDEENKCICSDYSNYEDITQCLTLEQCQNGDYSIINNGKKQCYKKKEMD